MKGIRIRLQGEKKRLESAVALMRQFFTISKQSEYFDCLDRGQKATCLTVYLYGRGPNPYDQLDDCKRELLEWQESASLLKAENEKLKQQLGLMPCPKPGDMVLGSANKEVKNG